MEVISKGKERIASGQDIFLHDGGEFLSCELPPQC